MAWMVYDYPDPPAEKEWSEPVCPICGRNCDTYYKTKDYDIIGCDRCVTACDAWEEIDDDIF